MFLRSRFFTFFDIKNGVFKSVFGIHPQQLSDPQYQCIQNKSFVESGVTDLDFLEPMMEEETQTTKKNSSAFVEREVFGKFQNEQKEVDLSTSHILKKSQYCMPADLKGLLYGMQLDTNLLDYADEKQADVTDYYFDIPCQMDLTNETYSGVLFIEVNAELPGPAFNAVLIWLGFLTTFYKCSWKIVACAGPTQQTSSQARYENGSSGSTSSGAESANTSASCGISPGGSSSGEGGDGEDERENRRRLNLPADAPDLTPEEQQRLEEGARSHGNSSQDTQGALANFLVPASGLFLVNDIDAELSDSSTSTDEAANTSAAHALRNLSSNQLLHVPAQDPNAVPRNTANSEQMASQQVQVLRRENEIGDIFRNVPQQLAEQMRRTAFYYLRQPRAFTNHLGVRGQRICCSGPFWGPPLQICYRCHGTICSECEQMHREDRCP